MGATLDEKEIDNYQPEKKNEVKQEELKSGKHRYYVTLFEPQKGKDIKEKYPELNKYKEFEDLNNKKMTFVWLVGNKTSQLVISGLPLRTKIEKALKSSGLEAELSPDEIAKWLNNMVPEEIAVAIKRMEIFDPATRARATLLSMKIFENYEKILNDEIEESDSIEQRISYIEMAEKARKGIPDLVQQIELSYGIEIKKEKIKDGISSEKLMDKVLNAE